MYKSIYNILEYLNFGILPQITFIYITKKNQSTVFNQLEAYFK